MRQKLNAGVYHSNWCSYQVRCKNASYGEYGAYNLCCGNGELFKCVQRNAGCTQSEANWPVSEPKVEFKRRDRCGPDFQVVRNDVNTDRGNSDVDTDFNTVTVGQQIGYAVQNAGQQLWRHGWQVWCIGVRTWYGGCVWCGISRAGLLSDHRLCRSRAGNCS